MAFAGAGTGPGVHAGAGTGPGAFAASGAPDTASGVSGGAPGAVPGVGAAGSGYDGLAPPEPERGRVKMSTVLVPPLVTALLLACGTGAFFGLRWADGFVSGAGAATVAEPAGVGGQNQAGGCVVGRWKVTSIEENSEIDEFGMVHFTGGGGTITFADDGSGTHDHTGMVENAQVGGHTFTVSFAGSVNFAYTVVDGRVDFDYRDSTVTASVQVNDAHAPASAVAFDDGAYKLGCAGNSMTITATNGGFRASRLAT